MGFIISFYCKKVGLAITFSCKRKGAAEDTYISQKMISPDLPSVLNMQNTLGYIRIKNPLAGTVPYATEAQFSSNSTFVFSGNSCVGKVCVIS